MAFNLRGRANLGGISLGVNIPIGVDPKRANKKTIDIGTNTTSDNISISQDSHVTINLNNTSLESPTKSKSTLKLRIV